MSTETKSKSILSEYFDKFIENYSGDPFSVLQGYIMGVALTGNDEEAKEAALEFVEKCRQMCVDGEYLTQLINCGGGSSEFITMRHIDRVSDKV